MIFMRKDVPMHKRQPSQAENPLPVLIPQLLTIDQVAAALNVGKSTVYELINHEGLPYVLVRGAKRIPVASLAWWIKQRECSSLYDVSGLHPQGVEMSEKPPLALKTSQASQRRKKRASGRKPQA
jgi:excisionase family DNA binding protein